MSEEKKVGWMNSAKSEGGNGKEGKRGNSCIPRALHE